MSMTITRARPHAEWPRVATGASATTAVASALVAWALPLSAALAQPAGQAVLPAQSEIAFVSRQMGVPVEGRFRQFSAQVAFDPAKPAASRIAFKVDVASITLGSREADAELPKPSWFHVAQFPQASFDSTAVKALGPGRFEVSGRLTIKGVSADVMVPVSLSQSGSGASMVTVATGSFPIKRLSYRIGEKEWADTSMVADEVQVRFKVALSGVPRL